jgi:flagellar biosynthesis protein FlhB
MEQPTNLFELQLDQPSLNYLNETARWARFLSIVGFVSCGLMVIMGVFFGSVMSGLMSNMGSESVAMLSGGFFSIFYVLLALLVFFPSFYLFSFSSKMRKAYQNNDQQILTDSLKNLKSFFKFYGIFTIIILSFYALVIIAAIIGSVVGHRR